MKNLAALCIVMLMLTENLYAQKVDIGLNAGVVSNTAPQMNVWGESKSGGSSPTATLKLLYNINSNWQVGVAVGLVPLTYKTKQYRFIFSDVYLPTDIPEMVDYIDYVANPAIPVMAEANYKFKLGSFELYSGVSLGYFAVSYRSFGSFIGNDVYRQMGGGGLAGGMQAGGSWFFVPWCGLNMQLGMTYYEPYRLMAFPVTAGLRFRM